MTKDWPRFWSCVDCEVEWVARSDERSACWVCGYDDSVVAGRLRGARTSLL